MKKSTTLFAVLAVFMMTALFSCKKENVQAPDKVEEFSIKMLVVSPSGQMEKAIVVGSKDELRKAVDQGQRVLLNKASEKNNVFRPSVPGTGTGTGPIDNLNTCWSEINAAYDAGLPTWQALANETCTPVMVCLTCPRSGGGLFVMYEIKPNSIKCTKVIKFEELLAAFSFKTNDYNSMEVAEYISKR